MGTILRRLTRNDAVDVVLAAVAIALSVSVLANLDDRLDVAADAWWLAVLHSVPVVVRRRIPRTAFTLSAVAAVMYLLAGYPMVGLGLTGLLMMYSLGSDAPTRQSLLGLVIVEALLPFVLYVTDTGMRVDTLIGNGLALAAAWLIGLASRRRHLRGVEEQESAARRAVTDERLRIARELHDVVAHGMSVISIQAGMARVVMDDEPDRAKAALGVIERAAQDAMDEMRRLLQVLRTNGTAPVSLDPTPRLVDLDSLIAHAVGTGTSVEVQIEGQRRQLPPGLEAAAYRVVQEALTNVRKHAAGSSARLLIDYGVDELVIRVVSDLEPGAVGGANGHGLAGMRERVELYRGRLDANPEADGTFRVVARFPLGATAA